MTTIPSSLASVSFVTLWGSSHNGANARQTCGVDGFCRFMCIRNRQLRNENTCCQYIVCAETLDATTVLTKMSTRSDPRCNRVDACHVQEQDVSDRPFVRFTTKTIVRLLGSVVDQQRFSMPLESAGTSRFGDNSASLCPFDCCFCRTGPSTKVLLLLLLLRDMLAVSFRLFYCCRTTVASVLIVGHGGNVVVAMIDW